MKLRIELMPGIYFKKEVAQDVGIAAASGYSFGLAMFLVPGNAGLLLVALGIFGLGTLVKRVNQRTF
jgi:hypothetical protein